ncbi:hypothetical protein M011DRAFT_462591 [Sporormia fimetaria CBS 119925]|uniref:Uncharacterized protein n=1 Tax=Sporormia fimetaria CBS 119925 TaxID=1340428 RepID=A0A6A6UWV3_9PLEO|nr:hypothetical protein M011DRAFT_462591 [Sporormia fimetaria CBS 119925]
MYFENPRIVSFLDHIGRRLLLAHLFFALALTFISRVVSTTKTRVRERCRAEEGNASYQDSVSLHGIPALVLQSTAGQQRYRGVIDSILIGARRQDPASVA